MYVFVRELSTGIVLYSGRWDGRTKPNHNKIATMVAKQHNCVWRRSDQGDILVNFQPHRFIDWCHYDGRRYIFIQYNRSAYTLENKT